MLHVPKSTRDIATFLFSFIPHAGLCRGVPLKGGHMKHRVSQGLDTRCCFCLAVPGWEKGFRSYAVVKILNGI